MECSQIMALERRLDRIVVMIDNVKIDLGEGVDSDDDRSIMKRVDI
jgi:hypothetical protein